MKEGPTLQDGASCITQPPKIGEGAREKAAAKNVLARLVISLARVSLQGAKIRDSRHSARQNVQKPGSGITKKGKNGNSFCASAVSLLSPWEKSGEKFFSLWRSILGLAGEKGGGRRREWGGRPLLDTPGSGS